MAGFAAAAAEAIIAAQAILLSLQNALVPTAYLCPKSTTVETISSISCDYVVGGLGESGSILTYRLLETGATVCALEQGECPPFESLMPGLFTLLPGSNYDYKLNFWNDSNALQNLKPDFGLTLGKMIGGSGGISHMIHVPPCVDDYEIWSEAANDPSWDLEYLQYYFAKGENVKDKGVLEQNTSLHGTSGPTGLTKDESSATSDMIKANMELGFPYYNDTHCLSVTQPLLAIDEGERQWGPKAYLSKLIKNPNLFLLSGAVINKVNFNGNTATGINYTYNGVSYNLNANKQVILAAGAIGTPKILMLSGIGDKSTLAASGIESVVDNPHVGQNLMDHPGCVTVTSMEKNTEPAEAANPHKFPVPMLTVYDALNKSQCQPELQHIKLFFSPNATGLLQLCSYGFKYLDFICDAWYTSNINTNVVLTVHNLLHPFSRGSVSLNSADIFGNPIVKSGIFSNSADLNTFAQLMVQYYEPLLNTKTMQNIGAQFVDPGICDGCEKFTQSYWENYVLAMSSTMWHQSGTCAMGKVVDGNLNVNGVRNLKIADASIFPGMVSGNIASTVRAVAEKLSDIVKQEDGWIA